MEGFDALFDEAIKDFRNANVERTSNRPLKEKFTIDRRWIDELKEIENFLSQQVLFVENCQKTARQKLAQVRMKAVNDEKRIESITSAHVAPQDPQICSALSEELETEDAEKLTLLSKALNKIN